MRDRYGTVVVGDKPKLTSAIFTFSNFYSLNEVILTLCLSASCRYISFGNTYKNIVLIFKVDNIRDNQPRYQAGFFLCQVGASVIAP